MRIARIQTMQVAAWPRAAWVLVHTDDGLAGLGETWYVPRAIASVIHDVYAPFLIGQDASRIEWLWEEMFRAAHAMGFGGAESRALSAIDMALWDLAAKAAGKPLYEHLGGACRERIRLYNTCSVWSDDGRLVFDDPAALAHSLLAENITAVKVVLTDHLADEGRSRKLAPEELRRAARPLEIMRNAVGARLDIAHDGHGHWPLEPAIQIARAFEPLGLLWEEELMPALDVKEARQLAEATATPICGAERLLTRHQFRPFVEGGAFRVVMADVAWTGGVTETKRIASLARAHGLPVTLHGAIGPVNAFVGAHLSVHLPNVEIFESVRAAYRGWYREAVTPDLPVQDGHLIPPRTPGHGASLCEDVRRRKDCTVQSTDRASQTFHWPGFHSQHRPNPATK